MNPVFRHAAESDWNAIAALLQQAELPLDGAKDHLPHFLLALTPDGTLAGVAGLEVYGEVGLLRSVAVAERKKGLGSELVRRVLNEATQNGMRQVVLLTTTATDFFPRFGFRQIARSEAPAAVQQSIEFQEACPASATVMLLDLVAVHL